jgi:hypothetical protein
VDRDTVMRFLGGAVGHLSAPCRLELFRLPDWASGAPDELADQTAEDEDDVDDVDDVDDDVDDDSDVEDEQYPEDD